MNNKLFVRPKVNINAELRIICFPYAGGGISTFLPWVKLLPDNVELVIIQPPGRGTRYNETAHNNMEDLISELIQYIPDILDVKYIFFGHSLGSRVAFELMVQLKKLNLTLPEHFIVSGSRGPQVECIKKSIYNLPDSDFIAELKLLNGTPDDIINNAELMEIFLPLLRADFKIASTYLFKGKIKFSCPISIFYGDEDIENSFVTKDSWEDFFKNKLVCQSFPGDHFFIDTHTELVIDKVKKIISLYLTNTSEVCIP